eukprot:1553302-Alexandrium_andersonii.AAC.1
MACAILSRSSHASGPGSLQQNASATAWSLACSPPQKGPPRPKSTVGASEVLAITCGGKRLS